MTSILTLDLATKSGWASWAPGGEVRSGVVSVPGTGDNVGRFAHRYEQVLLELVLDTQPELIVFESPILPSERIEKLTGRKTVTNIATLRKLYGLAMLAEKLAYGRGIQVKEVNNASVRKHFVGKGRGDRKLLKRLTIEACRARGWDPENDDEADALSILDYTVHVLKLDAPWACGELFGVGEAA